MDVGPKTSGFYQQDAQRLAADEARRRSAPRAVPRIRLPDGPILFSGRERPLLKPDKPSNQNLPAAGAMPRSRRRWRWLAWLLIAPWAIIVLAGSIGLIGLVVRFGLRF